MVGSGERSEGCALCLVLAVLLIKLTEVYGSFWDSHIGLCHRPWETVYAHDHTGSTVYGHRQSLAAAVIAGDSIRVVLESVPDFQTHPKTLYVLQADNAVLSRGQVCIESLSHHNHFNEHFRDHTQGDTLWYLLLCSDTGHLHVLGVKLGSQRVISDRHVRASATWHVRSWAVHEDRGCWAGERSRGDAGGGSDPPFCDNQPSARSWPVYSHFATGTAVGRTKLSTLLEAVKRGQDVRASMRDRGYSFPMHALHWSEGERWVGGLGLLHVGLRLFPSHVVMRSDRPYLWLSSWSTTGRRHNSRWALQGHVSQGANQDTASLDWMTDACWRHMYTNDAQGQNVAGSLEELLASVRGGHRVRVVLGHMAAEADVVRIRGGHVAAQILSDLTPVASSRDHHHLLHDSPRWNWKVVHTTGTVHQHEVWVGNHSLTSQLTTTSAVSWFVDSRPWASLLRLANRNVISGHVTKVADAVRGGASVRVRIRHTSGNGDTFASSPSLKVVTSSPGPQITSAQILRFLGDEGVGDTEVRLQEQLVWWMTEVDTEGVMFLSAWNTARTLKYFEITLNPELEWFVNE